MAHLATAACTTDGQEISPSEVVSILATELRKGRTIIPLLGAGISAEAGVPMPSQLGHYLATLSVLFERPETGLANWPEPVELRRLISPSMQEHWVSLATFLRNEFGETLPNAGPDHESGFHEDCLDALGSRWRAILRHYCAARSVSPSTFAEAILREKRPGRGHVSAASLARMIGWRLILTTNFDTLIEEALDANEFPFQAHDVLRSDSLADQVQSKRGTVVLKLHDGPRSLISDDLLDTPYDERELAAFQTLFGTNPLILVVGYRGRDRRVTSLLNSMLQTGKSKHEDSINILWLTRDSAPMPHSSLAKHLGSSSLVYSRCGDASLFLQEIYVKLSTSFPSSNCRLRFLYQTAPRPRKARETNLDGQTNEDALPNSVVTIVTSRDAGGETSSILARIAKEQSKFHHVIWVDAEEFNSVHSILQFILLEIRKHSPSVPLLFAAESLIPVRTDANVPGSPELMQRLLECLQENRVLLIVDSVAEFGRAALAHSAVEGVHRQFIDRLKDFYAFLEVLAKSSRQVGDSRIAFSFSPPIRTSGDNTTSRQIRPQKSWPKILSKSGQESNELDRTFIQSDLPDPKKTTSIGRRDNNAVISPSESGAFVVANEPLQLKTLEGYEVLERIGKGGVGEVYKVKEEATGVIRACKILRTESPDKEEILRLFREAKFAGVLLHPAIPQQHHAGVSSDGRPFIISDFINGVSLRELMNDQNVPLELLMYVLQQIADALLAAGQKGVVHRDLKPDNILIDQTYRAFLVDFGLAQLLSDGPKTSTLVSGTPDYMSPEQAVADNVDCRSDYFSFGVVLYECLHKVKPFTGRNATEVMAAIGTIEPMFSIAPSDNRHGLELLARNCLQKERNQRAVPAQMVARISNWLTTHVPEEEQFIIAESRKLFENTFQRLQEAKGKNASRMSIKYVSQIADKYATNELIEAVSSALTIAGLSRQIQIVNRIVGRGNTRDKAVDELWYEMDVSVRWILLLCSVFRRPRSIVALRRIGNEILRHPEVGKGHRLPSLVSNGYVSSFTESMDPLGLEDATKAGIVRESSQEYIAALDYAGVDRLLWVCERLEFVVPETGGNFWMYSEVRNPVYQMGLRDSAEVVGALHERVSAYYYIDVFTANIDIRAFTEAVFHICSASRLGNTKDSVTRLERLQEMLSNEEKILTVSSEMDILLDTLREIREEFIPTMMLRFGKEQDQDLRGHAELVLTTTRAVVCDVLGKLYEATNLNNELILLRCQQIKDRFDDELSAFLHSSRKVGDFGIAPITQCQWISNALRIVANSNNELWSEQAVEILSNTFLRVFELCIDVSKGLLGIGKPQVATELFSHIDAAIAWHGIHSNVKNLPHIHEASKKLRIAAYLCQLAYVEQRMGFWLSHRTDNRGTLAAKSLISKTRVMLHRPIGAHRNPAETALIHLYCGEARILAAKGLFTEFLYVIDRAFVAAKHSEQYSAPVSLFNCEIVLAGGLMRQSDFLFSGEASNNSQKSNDQLTLAEDSLRKARSILETQRGDARSWLALYAAYVQLRHEQLLLYLCAEQSAEFWNESASLFLEALALIGSVIRGAGESSLFESSLLMLRQQFFVCCGVAVLELNESRKLSSANLELTIVDRWKRLNEEAGTSWMLRFDGNDELLKRQASRLRQCVLAYRRTQPRGTVSLRAMTIDVEKQLLDTDDSDLINEIETAVDDPLTIGFNREHRTSQLGDCIRLLQDANLTVATLVSKTEAFCSR